MGSQTKLSVIIDAQDKASKVFREVGSEFEKTGKKMEKIGKSMLTKVTLPILGVGVVAVKSFADFDQAMTKSIAIMNTTIEQEERMKKVARDVANSTAFSHKQAADAYFYLASAGLGANEAMASMPAVAKFAQAGAFDLALATDLLTDAQSALGMTIRDDAVKNMKNMIKVSDVLVKANTLANATVEQFSTSLTTEAAAAMKSFGMDMEEGVAVLAAFADQGVKGQVAGSGFSRILRLLTKAANDNKKEMSDLGITIYNSQGNIRNMADIIRDLEDALQGMSDEQRTVALESIGFTARVQGIILPLLGTSDAIREYEKNLRIAGGITEEVAEKQLKSFTNQMKIVRDIVIDAAMDIGEILVPYIKKLGEKIKELTAKFKSLTPAQQENIVKILALTAAIGPLLIILGAMATGISVIATVLGLILSPIGLVVGSIVALGFTVVTLLRIFDQATGKITKLAKSFGILKRAAGSAVKDLSRDMGIIKRALGFKDSVANVEESFSKIQEKGESTALGMSSAFTSNGQQISGVWQGVKDTTTSVFGSMKNTSGVYFDSLGNGYSAAAEIIGEKTIEMDDNFSQLLEGIGATGDSLTDEGKKVEEAFEKYMGSVKDFNTRVKDEIEATIGKVADLQEKLVNLEKNYNEKRKDNNTSYAQAYLDQENKIKDTKKEIGDAAEFEDRERLKTKLAEQIAVLEQFSWMEKTYHTEIDYLRAEALKSELQRQVEKLKSKERHESAEFQRTKEKILKELAEEERKYMELVKLQEKGLAQYATYLASSEAMTAASIDREITKYNALADAVARARQAQASYSGYSFSAQNAISRLTGARAGGGSVVSGGAYLVGEKGPEIFSPGQNGNIIPNGAGGGVVVNINGGIYLSEEVAEDIGDRIIDKLKYQIKI